MHSPKPSIEWLSQWTRLEERVALETRLLANRINGRMPFFISRQQHARGLDGTLYHQWSVQLIAGNRLREITLVVEGYPERGFAISVHCSLGMASGALVPMEHSFLPATTEAMAKVAEFIERMKAGEEGRYLFAM